MIDKTFNEKGFSWVNLNNLKYKGFISKNLKDLNKVEMDIYSKLMGTDIPSIEILGEISKESNLSELKKLVNKINGQFVIIREDDDILFAAVDNIRSMPLFYKIEDGKLKISDIIYSIMGEKSERDDIAAKEFISSGMTWSNRTLDSDIKALSAGEFIFLDKNSGDFIHDKYMRFSYKKGYDNSLKSSKDRIRNAYSIAVKDLAKFADGNTIMLPLSAGQDSRIVAYQLKEFGYENVICYSYGIRGNHESEISKKIAEFLGYKWLFAPYDDIDWKEWYNSSEYRDFSHYSSNLVSTPHFQDYHAVKYFKLNNLIPDNAVFAPGHSGDFIHGDHIPKAFIKASRLELDYISKELLKEIANNRWYSSNELSELLPDIKKVIGPKPNPDRDDMIEYYEYFDWIERQSKQIANAVRVYEFFGYKWYMMLWNRVVFEAWSTIEPELRYHRNLHYKIVEEDQRDLRRFICDESKGNPDGGIKNNIKDMARRIMPGVFKRLVFNRDNKNLISGYDSHHLNWNKIKSRDEFMKIASSCSNINGIVATDILNNFDEEYNWD
ncbi:MAG: hypothetical protein Q4P34_07085 [Tissierellia bacterium]|nr:hypothetical protein [Tissierellia bacterium]